MSFRPEQGGGLPPYEMTIIKDLDPLTIHYRMVYPTILSFDFQPGGAFGFGEARIDGIHEVGVVFHNSSRRAVGIAIEFGGPQQQPQTQDLVI